MIYSTNRPASKQRHSKWKRRPLRREKRWPPQEMIWLMIAMDERPETVPFRLAQFAFSDAYNLYLNAHWAFQDMHDMAHPRMQVPYTSCIHPVCQHAAGVMRHWGHWSPERIDAARNYRTGLV